MNLKYAIELLELELKTRGKIYKNFLNLPDINKQKFNEMNQSYKDAIKILKEANNE